MRLSGARTSVIAFAVSAVVLVGGCAVSATATGPAYPASNLEWNVDRPGGDYRSFDLPAANPGECQAACMNEAPCVAFTYVNPGVQGPNARCLPLPPGAEKAGTLVPAPCVDCSAQQSTVAADAR